MKKIVLNCLVGFGCLVGSANAGEYDIKSGDIKNFYNFKQKKCDTLTFNNKANIIRDLRNGYMIVDEKYINEAGETFVIIGSYPDGSEFEMILTSNYNQCRFYEDLVIKKMDVNAKSYMTPPAKN